MYSKKLYRFTKDLREKEMTPMRLGLARVRSKGGRGKHYTIELLLKVAILLLLLKKAKVIKKYLLPIKVIKLNLMMIQDDITRQPKQKD